jgi:dCTP deaminase
MPFFDINYIYDVLNEKDVISPFDKARIKNGAYELSLGTEVYLTDSSSKKVELLSITNRGIDINPGQLALLQTKEKVKVPIDKIAFISIKAGEKLKGLINVSGFHVDPGFNDHLIFSVYNASPSTIILNYDEPYFPIWFTEFKSQSNTSYGKNNEHFNKLSHIPTKYIEFLKRGELTSPKALLDKINELKTELDGKILKSDEKKLQNDWLYKFIIGLLVVVGVKVLFDWSTYDKGYNDAKNYKTVTEQLRAKIDKHYLDSLVTIKIDSIVKSKKSYVNTTKND